MFGASFENWADVVGSSYYTGFEGGEVIWLFIAIALCVISLFVGHSHESKANS